MTSHPLHQHARALAALELAAAARIRRDISLGLLCRRAARFAHRDHVRTARACTVAATLVGGLA